MTLEGARSEVEESRILRVRDGAIAAARAKNPQTSESRPTVSIITPVFDVEAYLAQCIESLLAQSLNNIEIVCVNDASTDASAVVLEEYARRDSRLILVEHPINLGLGAARNTGLACARGEYVAFVDSDDWVTPDAFTKLHESATAFDSDLVLCAFNLFDEEAKRIEVTDYHDLRVFGPDFDGRGFQPSDADQFLCRISVTAWAKLYRTTALNRVLARFPDTKLFPDTRMAFEDNVAFFKVFPSVERVSLVRERLGSYRVNRPDSIMGRRAMAYADCVRASRQVKEILEHLGIFAKHRIGFFAEQVINQHVHWYSLVLPEYKEPFFKLIREDIVDYSLSDSDIEALVPDRRAQYLCLVHSHDAAEFDRALEDERWRQRQARWTKPPRCSP